MTIADVIDRLAVLRPHQFEDDFLIDWISRLDHIVWEEVIQTHVLPSSIEEGESFAEHIHKDESSTLDVYPDADAVPLIDEVYGMDIYTYWLMAQMDKVNGETDRFNQDMAMFQASYDMYTGWYNKHYMPRMLVRRFLF